MAHSTLDPPVAPALAKEHGLTQEEFERIKKILGREPNLTKLGIFSVYGASTAPTKIRRKFGYRGAISCPKAAGFAEQLLLAIPYGAQIHPPRTRSRHKLLCKRSSTKLSVGRWCAHALLSVFAPSRRCVWLLPQGISSSCPTPRPASGDPRVAMSPTAPTACRERFPF